MANAQQIQEVQHGEVLRRQTACIPPQESRRVLVLSGPFPSVVDPGYGVFVKERVRAVADLPGYEIRVISPVPYFPPLRQFPRWYQWSQFPREETVSGLSVLRPRYVLPPKIGGYFNPRLMYRAVCRAIDRLRLQFEFDLIDAHFVYPMGVVGAMLGRRYAKPVIMTGRGEDMLRFPGLPHVGRQIRWAMQQGSQFVALSQEIADAYQQSGAPADRITVIPNGVDTDRFRPARMEDERLRLGLPLYRPIVVSVGNLQERKGFHLLVDAIPRIRSVHPDVLVVIVGGAAPYGKDFRSAIEARVREQGLDRHVKLAGSVPHEELSHWYSAADLFVLLSSREGSPNVLMEALACGTPAIATAVGGIPEVLVEEHLGMVLPERSAAAAAQGVIDGLSRTWDRAAIRRTMEGRSWRETARTVSEVFSRALAQSAAARTGA